ncbi:MAG: hypothetical protein R2932_06795 [Caldilineaceae bacterium]
MEIALTTVVVLAFDTKVTTWHVVRDGQILLYTLSEQDGLYRLRHHVQKTESPIWRLLFSPDATQVAWVNAKQEIQTLDLETGEVGKAMHLLWRLLPAFARDGQTFFTDGATTVLIRRAKPMRWHTLRGHTLALRVSTAIQCAIRS